MVVPTRAGDPQPAFSSSPGRRISHVTPPIEESLVMYPPPCGAASLPSVACSGPGASHRACMNMLILGISASFSPYVASAGASLSSPRLPSASFGPFTSTDDETLEKVPGTGESFLPTARGKNSQNPTNAIIVCPPAKVKGGVSPFPPTQKSSGSSRVLSLVHFPGGRKFVNNRFHAKDF